MSFLTLEDGIPDFTQAVISFWFRLPKASLQKGADSYVDPYQNPLEFSWVYGEFGIPKKVLSAIVPLVTFGRPQTTTVWGTDQVVSGSYIHTVMEWVGPDPDFQPGGYWQIQGRQPETAIAGSITTIAADQPLNPCFIGVECVPAGLNGDWPVEDIYVLKVNLQMDRGDAASHPSLAMVNTSTSVSDWTDWNYGSAAGYSFRPLSYNNYGAVWADGNPQPITNPDAIYPIWDDLPKSSVDLTYTYTEIPAGFYQPEFFILGGQNTGARSEATTMLTPTKLIITPDEWHHVIISLDLTSVETHDSNWNDAGPVANGGSGYAALGAVSTAKGWIALDGENITKYHLSPFWPKGPDGANWESGGDPNAILTYYGYGVAASVHGANEVDFYNFNGTWLMHHQATPRRKFSYTTAGVPSANAPFCIPGGGDQVDSVYKVEMAEFQMWTGVKLDTSADSNVALFLTDDGRPNLKFSTADNPDAPPGPDDILGPPLIRLHGSSNWIKGKNTGQAFDPSTGNPIDTPQFDPTGKIKVYHPNPSLYGAQGAVQSAIRLSRRAARR